MLTESPLREPVHQTARHSWVILLPRSCQLLGLALPLGASVWCGCMESVQEVTATPLMLVPLSQRLAVQEGLTTVALVGLACVLFWLNARLPQEPTEAQMPPED